MLPLFLIFGGLGIVYAFWQKGGGNLIIASKIKGKPKMKNVVSVGSKINVED